MPYPRLRGAGTVASADVLAFYPETPAPWGGDELRTAGRNFPALAKTTAPTSSLPAGMRTQPIVGHDQRRDGWNFMRSHVPIERANPGPIVPPVISSQFQPIAIDPQGNVTETTSTDWRWPARFSGLWSRAGLLALASPGGAEMGASPRWSRVVRVPRYSTLPGEIIPRG